MPCFSADGSGQSIWAHVHLQEVVCGFISEALAGRNTVVHTVYYEADDDDGMTTIPGQYADRGQTADYLRQMAHVTNGRFHWFRNRGKDRFGQGMPSVLLGLEANSVLSFLHSSCPK